MDASGDNYGIRRETHIHFTQSSGLTIQHLGKKQLTNGPPL